MRQRNLASGFFTNPILAKLPPLTRFMFQGVWLIADFDGCFRWEPDHIAMKVLPKDDFDAVEAMDALENGGFIRKYLVAGKPYGFVVEWHKYQDPHPGERAVHPKPVGHPDFKLKVKAKKWRREDDTAFGDENIEPGIYSSKCPESATDQLASNLRATCQQPASQGREGNEGTEGLGGPVPGRNLNDCTGSTQARALVALARVKNLGRAS